MAQVLPGLAAILSATAFYIYFQGVVTGTSVPNPASWSVWALLALLNAFNFRSTVRSTVDAVQFFVGGGMCFAVFGYAFWHGSFSPIETMEIVVLVLCVVAGSIWCFTKAEYGSLVIAGIFWISSWATIEGTWANPDLERALPWWLWTAAFSATFVNVFRKLDKTKQLYWVPTVVPISGLLIHATVALGAKW